MDFNPLDILAAAALGEKDAPPDVKPSRQGVDHSENQDIEPIHDSKDDKVDASKEMGKTTCNDLKTTKIDNSCEETMAPQKIDWSTDTFLSSHLDSMAEKFSLDQLVSDLKKKSLELHKLVDHSSIKSDVIKDLPSNDLIDTALNEQYNTCVSEKNAINEEVEKDSKPQEECINNSQSDIESVDSKSPEIPDSVSDITQSEIISLDHSYALIPGKTHYSSYGDDDIDVGSDHSPLTEETEQRSRNLSIDFNYLKTGILEGVSASTLDLYKISGSGRSKFPSTSSSSSSPTADLSKSPSYNDGNKSPAPKYGKFKIGTLGSFSSGNLELEKYLKNQDLLKSRKVKVGIPVDRSFHSPVASPLSPSPYLDWDRSDASSETQEESLDGRTPLGMSPEIAPNKVTEWSHPMYHDHDYCIKSEWNSCEEMSSLLLGKRKYTKRKSKYQGMSHEKFMKAKYLKKELLKGDSFIKTPSQQDLAVETASLKSNPVGRPRKRPIEKIIDEEIDPETGTKLKITGRFQDQYVYYLSKTSRTTTRRRQPLLFPPTTDRIIVPAPKPGDIVVPHLTDADIETVRVRGRGALNLPDRPHMTPSSLTTTNRCTAHSSEFISDVDSHIVSTILSMESDNLASPTTSHASDTMPHSSELHPNQPVLIEGLRHLGGDSSMTSEHVLNYLLSVVKDEHLLNADSHFDSVATSLFPSIPDSLYSNKSDVLNTNTSGSDLMEMGKNFCNSTLSHKDIHDGFGHSDIGKDHMDDCVGLPDDLTSFMSNSQGTSSSSNTTQDGDSLKSMFGSDLSSLGAPQMSSSVPRLTSIEKTLDYLGVRDDEIKLPSVYSSKLDQESEPLTPLSCTSDDTPWIVTVTLYFNDVPAIMINNQPYIRLVDIHKQILPAKDTGILKKRCQLLKIPVLNCTEMQRYFLVQYGRAYNSKSTLVVSKEQATHLVTYYATPQPRVGRSDESHQRQASSSAGSEACTRSPVANIAAGIFRKRTNKGPKKVATSSSSLDVSTLAANKETEDCISNKRTRHKKVNYLEMLKGEEKDKTSNALFIETIESVVKAGPLALSDTNFFKVEITHKKNNARKKKLVQHRGKKRAISLKWTRESHKSKINKATQEKKTLEKLSDLESDDTSDAAQHKKFKPLKLKVNSLINLSGQRKSTSPNKKGLFSRSNSHLSATNRHVRILAVAHQAAIAGANAESRLPSQPADIHLDLFTKSNSACVRCETCSQFLSVPHFMRHHHVPMDNEWLASEAADRILVPRNKDNISEHEKELWEEFHKLQESIGGFGETDDETDTDGDYDDCEGGTSELSSVLLHKGKHLHKNTVSTSPIQSSSDDDSVDMDLPGSPEIEENTQNSSVPLIRKEDVEQSSTSHLRTSSRKRKSKQLFSIENYYTPKRWSTEEESLNRSDNSGNVSLQSRSRISS